MSLATWKQEFYPIAATEVSKEDALDHSLQKWEGLERENLDKHGVGLAVGILELSVRDETGGFRVTADTSALCLQHPECDGCPLVQVRGGACCDEGAPSEKLPPWQAFWFHKDPAPMLALLRQAKELEGAK